MKHEVLRRMDELGCDPALRSVVEQLPADVDVVVNEGVGDFLPLAGAPGAVAALYMNVRHCHLALDPADAARLAAATRSPLLARSVKTHRVKITAAVAAQPELQPLVVEHAATALRRSRGDRPVASTAPHGGALDFPCVLLRINQAWREGMDVDQVYDVTHGCWVMGPQREQAEFAVAVAGGLVRGVFAIHGWRPRHLADDGGPAERTRWGFDGAPSLEHEHLIGTDLSHLFPQGAANPVRYLNLTERAAPASASVWDEDRDTSDRRTSVLAGLCADLAANPVLTLSHHSKELFHSNLVGLICGRSIEVAVAVLGPLLEADPAQTRHDVEFERQHLDLIVHLPGYRPVVIENKVFSLPDEGQLDGYAARNIPAAGVPRATKVLLSLTDPGWSAGRYGSWTWLSYEAVATRMLPAVEKHLSGDRFVAELVRHWTAMVDVLLRIATAVAPAPDQPLLLDGDAVGLLEEIRLHDVVQKLRTRQVRHLLQQHLERSGVGVDDLESAFGTAGPLLSGRLSMPDGAEIGWQLQAAQWRRFVIVPELLQGRSDGARQKRIDYTQSQHPTWFDFSTEQAHGPFQPAPTDDYKHFAPNFVYDYVKMPGISVAMVLTLAEAVLRDAAAYRASWQGPVDI